ncbi:MAG: cyclic nucleotide-binding domain-containing protein [Granulosicoccus sp.]
MTTESKSIIPENQLPITNDISSSSGLDHLSGGENHYVDDRVDRLKDDDQRNKPHAFVVMPFGMKEGINFDIIYDELIRPALLESGFKPFRADEETVSGDILTDMFQELLLADLVVVDMSIDNANVFYELGVRHALRKRGVVHIQSGRARMPFDVFSVRTLPYHLNEDGVPDKEHIERDKKSLISVTRDTWASNAEAIHSPVFGLLPGLKEPVTSSLCTPLATGFWNEFNQWEQRVALARRQKRVGDILLLTYEIDNPLCKEEAVIQAGMALSEMGFFELALQEYQEGLLVNPGNLFFRRQEGKLLNLLGRVDEAILKLESLLQDAPNDARAISHLGRIYLNIWQECWEHIEDTEERQAAAFDSCQWAIKSMDTYLRGFNIDRNNLEPGIKALTIASLLVPLADKFDVEEMPDADLSRIRALFPLLKDSLLFALQTISQSEKCDFWTWSSLGNWHLLNGDSSLIVNRLYRKALSYGKKNISQLRSSLKQLHVFKSLGIYLDQATKAGEVIRCEINRIEAGQSDLHRMSDSRIGKDVRAFLFSGHMLDKQDVEHPRFPASLEDEVRRQVDLSLDRGNATPKDHAYTSGAACGGDIIFIEACVARGMQVHVHMPCDEAHYVRKFISHAGESWITRYYDLRSEPLVKLYYQEERIGIAAEGVDPYVRNVRWSLFASLVHGVDKLRLIALWDGESNDEKSVSGKKIDQESKRVCKMVSMTELKGGIVDHIHIGKLEYLFRDGLNELEDTPAVHVSMDARIGLLKKVALFSTLHRVDLTQIARHSVERHYTAGQVLAKQGQSGDELFIIASGEISVRSITEDGNEIEVARRGAGDYVGELALLHEQSRMASLVAVSEVLVLTIDQAKFQRILRARPQTGQAITRTLVKRLSEATAQTLEMG